MARLQPSSSVYMCGTSGCFLTLSVPQRPCLCNKDDGSTVHFYGVCLFRIIHEYIIIYEILFIFQLSIHLTCYVSFRCTTQWLHMCLSYKAITPVILVSIWHHTQLSHIIDCIAYVVLYMPANISVKDILYFSIPFTFFTQSLKLPFPSSNHQLFLCIYDLFPLCLLGFLILHVIL